MNHNIILDIDGILACFTQGLIDYAASIDRSHLVYASSAEDVKSWDFFHTDLWHDIKTNEDFWLNLKPLKNAHSRLNIVPKMYLTSRPISNEVSKKWLEKHNFPSAVVRTVSKPTDKVRVMMEEFPDCILIDDHVQTVEEILQNGGNVFLYKAPYQVSLKTDHLPSIETIEEINELFIKCNL